jgi:hypothetical protein
MSEQEPGRDIFRLPSTELNDDEFNLVYPVGSQKRQDEERVNPRPETIGNSEPDFSSEELSEFRAWKESQKNETPAPARHEGF